MAARLERRARRATEQRADRVSRSGQHHRTDDDHGRRRPRRPRSPAARFPHDLQRQWIQGTGPGAKPAHAGGQEHPQHLLRAAVRRRRLDVRRRGRARPALDDVARQPAQPEAGDPPRRGVPQGRRSRGRRDERLGAVVLRPDDHRRLAEAARVHHQDLPRPRPAPRRSPRAARRRPRLLGLDRRSRHLRREQPRPAARRRVVAGAVPAEDPDRRRGRALERHHQRGSRRTSACRSARSRPTCSSSSSKRCSS